MEYRNVKIGKLTFKSEKSNKNKHKMNEVLTIFTGRNCVLKFIEKEACLLLTFFKCLHNQLSSLCSMVT